MVSFRGQKPKKTLMSHTYNGLPLVFNFIEFYDKHSPPPPPTPLQELNGALS